MLAVVLLSVVAVGVAAATLEPPTVGSVLELSGSFGPQRGVSENGSASVYTATVNASMFGRNVTTVENRTTLPAPNTTTTATPEPEAGAPFSLQTGPLALAVALGVVLVLALVVLRSRSRSAAAAEAEVEDVPGDIGDTAGETADRIAAGDDTGAGQLDNEVYRAWAEMAGHLDIDDPETTTPREFARAAVDSGMDPEDVSALTGLFEAVRYGEQSPTADVEERAVDVLRRIERRYGEGGER